MLLKLPLLLRLPPGRPDVKAATRLLRWHFQPAQSLIANANLNV
jgi:hypothetical protein